MGDYHHGVLADVRDVVLEPHHGVQVQMVCGLIQQEDVGLDEQGAGQGDTHSPTSRKTANWATEHSVGEAQTSQNRRGS